MDWELVLMVAVGWVVSGGLMYLVYKWWNNSAKESFQDSPHAPNTLNHKKEWRIWLNGMAVLVLIAFFGFFFDDRGPNVHMPSPLLGMFF